MSQASTDTRERILDVAQDLIQRHGLNAMSFQDLSDAIGIKKASVHYHFPSKAEMVGDLLKRYRADFGRVVQGILDSRVIGKTKLRRYFGLFHATLEAGKHDKSCLCGMLAAELYSLNEKSVELVKDFLRDNVSHIEQMLLTGIEDGSLAVQGDVPRAAEMVLATLEGGLLIARCNGGPGRFAEITGQLLTQMSSD